MSSLKLSLHTDPVAGVDMSPLSPGKLAGMKHAEIAALKLRYGADTIAVGELFKPGGRADGEALYIEGGSSYLHYLGRALDAGVIVLDGDAGDYCALEMSGGRLEVYGNCGEFAGSGMSAGICVIYGDCGDDCGAIMANGTAAFSGGFMQVRGKTGTRAGTCMSGGTLVIEGRAGADLATDMKAGTVLALAGCARGAGRRMKRGTIIINNQRMQPPESFACNGKFDLTILRVIMRDISKQGKDLHFLAKYSILVHRYTGDLSVSGVGEFLVPSQVIPPN